MTEQSYPCCEHCTHEIGLEEELPHYFPCDECPKGDV